MKYDDVTIWILQKMYRNKIIGGKHISLQNLKTGLPSHIRGDADKKVQIKTKKTKNTLKSKIELVR